jgi:hypothetical protein
MRRLAERSTRTVVPAGTHHRAPRHPLLSGAVEVTHELGWQGSSTPGSGHTPDRRPTSSRMTPHLGRRGLPGSTPSRRRERDAGTGPRRARDGGFPDLERVGGVDPAVELVEMARVGSPHTSTEPSPVGSEVVPSAKWHPAPSGTQGQGPSAATMARPRQRRPAVSSRPTDQVQQCGGARSGRRGCERYSSVDRGDSSGTSRRGT